MSEEPAPHRFVAARDSDIAARLVALGLSGPVLVVADAAAIAAEAPAWASGFAAAGLPHRVILSGVDIETAAGDWDTRVVVAAGAAEAVAAARAAAAALGVPVVEP